MKDIDEAIRHCEEKAKEQRDKSVRYFNGGYSSQIDGKSCLKCAEEHEQLAEWLRELKALKEKKGEWIYGEDECGQDGWFCSKCGFFVPWYYQYYEKDIDFIRDYKVCPHCISEMVTYTGKDRDTKGGAT